MASKKKSGPKKASKGKSGCLKQNGRLKKGFKWAKGRKGYCAPAKAKKPAKKKGGKKRAPRVKKLTAAEAAGYLDVGGKEAAKYADKRVRGPTGLTVSEYLSGARRRR